jgi:hypothetical protein
MEVLAWVGKPIVLLLNQTGPPGEAGHAEERRWADHLADTGLVRASLTLDAFARCWVQERTLLRTIAPLLAEPRQPAMASLIGAWTERNLERFQASMRILAGQLATIACDREEVGERKWHDRVRGAVKDPAGTDSSPEVKRAMGKLGERVDQAVRSSTDELIALHGLSGRAASEVLKRMREDYTEAGRPAKALPRCSAGWCREPRSTRRGRRRWGADAWRGHAGRRAARRGRRRLGGARLQYGARRRQQFSPLVGRLLPRPRSLGLAALSRRRALWTRPRRVGGRRAPDELARRGRRTVAAERATVRAIWRQARDSEPAAIAVPLENVLARCAGRLLTRFYPDSSDLFEEVDAAPEEPSAPV